MRHLVVSLFFTAAAAAPAFAQSTPKPPLLSDPALRVEALAAYPEVETPTTVVGSPDGAFFVGNDPRDSRLNTKNPECTVVRYSSLGPDRKKTVFADKVYSPAGMLWHDGWLYLMHDPLLTRFKDSTGSGVADVREDLVTSLGQEPHEGLNDHVVSGITLGMDGFIYISVGDKGVFHAKGKDGSEVTLQGGGILRVRPDGAGLEIYSGGTRNHLEVDLDAFDHAFTLDNTDDGNGWWTRLTHHIESGYYGYPFHFKNDLSNGLMAPGPQKAQSVPGAPAVNERFLPAMTDFGGGSPTGGLCYLSDGLPEAYRGKLFFSEWGQRRVSVIDAEADGATYKFRRNDPLLSEDKGSDFRPMELYVAVDGSLLVADWGFGGWKAPKKAGAVWRVSWPEAKPAPRLHDEEHAALPALLTALGHPDRDQRLRAEWALVHRGEAAIPGLIELLHTEAAPPVQRAHALWALDLLGSASPATREKVSGLIRQMLTDRNAPLRGQAVRALAIRGVAAAGDEISALLKDPEPEVRLQAAIALGRLHMRAAAANLRATLSDEDRWVRFAARTALEKLGDWVALVPVLKAQDSRAADQAWLAITSVFDPEAVTVLTHLAHDRDPAVRARAAGALGRCAYLPAEWDGHWWGTQPVKSPPPPNRIAWAGTHPASEALARALNDSDTAVRLAAAQALSLGVGPDALPALRQRLSSEENPAVRRQLIETLGVQRDPEALKVFTAIALDQKADPEFRDTAIGAVASIGGDEARKTMAQLATVAVSPAATLKVIEAVGEMKLTEAAPALFPHLNDADPSIRLATIKALAALGPKAGAVEQLMAALGDKDRKVSQAAVEALGSLKDQRALPALIEFAHTRKAQRETIAAIAAMPDSTAIPVLLEALRDKNASVRREAIKGLKKLRSEAWPRISEMLARGELPAEAEPEIKAAFESGVITRWKMIGPFENVWSAVHPPEADALRGGEFLSKKYVNAEGKEVGWRDVSGDADHGHVNLGQVFHNNGMVCAYATAQINSPTEADAQLICGSDDQIAVWVNGVKALDSSGTRGYDPEQDRVTIHLHPGANRLLVKIGNISGEWEFAMRIPGLDGERFTPATEPPADVRQRTYALAVKPDGSWQHAGDPAHGEALFFEQTAPLGGICATCHAVKGKGGQVGPDLSAIAANYRRPDLITSIQEPSKTIALGFEQFVVETKGGETFAGAIRQDTADAITILGADALPHQVRKSEVKTKTPVPTSIMPQGLTLGLKNEDFVDLLAYLETLRGK